MIEIFEGRLGGGKTYHAVKRIVQYIANGGCVWCNIELNIPAITEYLRARYQWDLQPGQINTYDGEQIKQVYQFVPPGCPESPNLVILDEAHIYLNARDWAKADRLFLEWMTHTRHLSVDVVMISQSLYNIDKQITRLVQYIWRFRDLQKWGCAEFGFLWPIPQFMVSQYDYDGRSQISPNKFELKDKDIYGCYNTYQMVSKFPVLESRKKKWLAKSSERTIA